MVLLFPLASFTTIYVFLGLLGSIASIWGLIHALKRKKNKSVRAPTEHEKGYERGFSFEFRTFKKPGK